MTRLLALPSASKVSQQQIPGRSGRSGEYTGRTEKSSQGGPLKCGKLGNTRQKTIVQESDTKKASPLGLKSSVGLYVRRSRSVSDTVTLLVMLTEEVSSRTAIKHCGTRRRDFSPYYYLLLAPEPAEPFIRGPQSLTHQPRPKLGTILAFTVQPPPFMLSL
jgi:hypothetical protein